MSRKRRKVDNNVQINNQLEKEYKETESEEAQINKLYNVSEVKEHFHILEVIGSGTFSSVFKAKTKKHGVVGGLPAETYALKRIMHNCNPTRMVREIECLRKLAGKQYIVSLESVIRQEDTVILMLEYFEHEAFNDYVNELTPSQIQKYMKAMMQALDYVHKAGILHRDVKPNNFLYHRKHGQYRLVDFGLAQFIGEDGVVAEPLRVGSPSTLRKTKKKTSLGHEGYLSKDVRLETRAARAGTRGFRSPEVLLKCVAQSPAIDVWSAGVILLSFLSGRSPFFQSNDDGDAVFELIEIFGLDALKDAAKSFGKELLAGSGTSKKFPVQEKAPYSLKNLCTASNDRKLDAPDLAYEFLEKCLILSPANRITAEAALRDPYLANCH
eukprot:m.42439 g.42439  ORF g.42439 m.42439 type:complete len:383 (-) comp9882_c0_seq1:63-1211(-)